MTKCKVCGFPYYSQSYCDPAEPCICGEGVIGTPWEYDGWNGVRNWLRYRVATAMDSKWWRNICEWAYAPYHERLTTPTGSGKI